MRKLLFLGFFGLFLSCSSDDQPTITEETVDISIQHFKTTSVLYGTALIASEDNQSAFKLPGISEFNFEPGFTYQLRTIRTTTQNPGTNATTSAYRLSSIQTQDTIPPNTRFSVPLAQFTNGLGYVTWIRGSVESGYILNNEIPIDCGALCSQLAGSLVIEDAITGEFEHGPNGSYRLLTLY